MDEKFFNEHIELGGGTVILDRCEKPEGVLLGHRSLKEQSLDLGEVLGRVTIAYFFGLRYHTYARLYSWKFQQVEWYNVTLPCVSKS